MNIDINALIGFLTLFITVLIQGNCHSKSMGILENKVDELGKKQDKHNGLIERMVIVESSTKSSHHRLDETNKRIDEMIDNCHQVLRNKLNNG